MRVFVSAYDVDARPACLLIVRLGELGVSVDHSPRPDPAVDDRWSDWYAHGLRAALVQAHAAVVVIDEVWDSSTWMAEEARVATDRADRDGMRYFTWNPSDVDVKAAGMIPYLRNLLPANLKDAADRIVGAV